MNNGAVLSTWNLVVEASPTTSPWVTKLQTPSGCFYLKASASTESVERDLDLLEYLAGARLPVPRYIATAAGQRYAVAEGRAFWLSRELPGHHFARDRSGYRKLMPSSFAFACLRADAPA